jgi:hypothetical protein
MAIYPWHMVVGNQFAATIVFAFAIIGRIYYAFWKAMGVRIFIVLGRWGGACFFNAGNNYWGEYV